MWSSTEKKSRADICWPRCRCGFRNRLRSHLGTGSPWSPWPWSEKNQANLLINLDWHLKYYDIFDTYIYIHYITIYIHYIYIYLTYFKQTDCIFLRLPRCRRFHHQKVLCTWPHKTPRQEGFRTVLGHGTRIRSSQRMALALQKAASGRGTDHECHHRPENIDRTSTATGWRSTGGLWRYRERSVFPRIPF